MHLPEKFQKEMEILLGMNIKHLKKAMTDSRKTACV